MVRLTRIYTKTGDTGMTSLGSGRRVRKDNPRIEASGDVDELNATLGLAIASGLDSQTSEILQDIQNDLFDLGADLTVPATASARARGTARRAPLRMTAEHVLPLEQAIDASNARLSPLTSFVLP